MGSMRNRATGMKTTSKIYVAGHRGLVGSATLRRLETQGFANLIRRTHTELDLERQAKVEAFFQEAQPEYVFLAAARVGGILANASYPGEFIYQNLIVQANVLHSAWRSGVKRLLFLGSSCIYPRDCPQPMREEHLLSGPLEATNRPYAVAKIAGIEQCAAYNRQYGTRFLSVMPTNLYGDQDNYDLETSHVLPALIRKFHLGKLAAVGDWDALERDEQRFGLIPPDVLASLAAIARAAGHDTPSSLTARSHGANSITPPAIILWGTGGPRRELLHVDDLADACVFLMNLDEATFASLCLGPETPMDDVTPSSYRPLINIGCEKDFTIRELSEIVTEVVGYRGEIRWDSSKPDGTPRKLLDVGRVKSLGWTPKISLRQGVAATYRWYLENL
jgi:GDP-L-fucose synthase